jgi:hypothetical protein
MGDAFQIILAGQIPTFTANQHFEGLPVSGARIPTALRASLGQRIFPLDVRAFEKGRAANKRSLFHLSQLFSMPHSLAYPGSDGDMKTTVE